MDVNSTKQNISKENIFGELFTMTYYDQIQIAIIGLLYTKTNKNDFPKHHNITSIQIGLMPV